MENILRKSILLGESTVNK